ncbi:MAG TPA: nuclear transport factor 2 family protein [Solirubrobacteraceae bacterium]|jgi:ketosteroid isomerase-like protein
MPEESAASDLVELTRQAIDASRRGDIYTATGLFAGDVVWESLDGLGVFEGVTAVRGFLEDFAAGYESFDTEPEEIRDMGGGVVFAVIRHKGRLAGGAGAVEGRFAWALVLERRLVVRVVAGSDIGEVRRVAERLAEESQTAMARANMKLLMSLAPSEDADLVHMYRDDENWAALTDTAAAAFHPDCESVRPGLPGGRTYIGLDGLRSAWLDWLAPWASYHVEIEQAIDCGDRILLLVNNFGRLEGSTEVVTNATAGVYTFRDGRIARWEIYSDRAEALNAVGLG